MAYDAPCGGNGRYARPAVPWLARDTCRREDLACRSEHTHMYSTAHGPTVRVCCLRVPDACPVRVPRPVDP
eukprot:3008065-Prymnesium_polylepis.1